MTRAFIFTGVMLAAGLTTLHVMDDQEPQKTQLTPEVTTFDEQTVTLAVNYQCFKGTFETALLELERREIKLEEAVRRVYAASQQYCPIYLHRIRISDPGESVEGCVARNLVGHVRSLEESRPSLCPRVWELEVELENLVNQWESSSVR